MADKCADDSVEAAPVRLKPLKPNYFVAIQITDKKTIKGLIDEQRDILSRYPDYEDFLIPPNSFHLTLTVLQLDSDTEIQACIEAMNQAKADIVDMAKKAGNLTFQGLDRFGTKVIFAKVIFSNQFLVLVDAIRNSLKKAHIKLELSPLKPHVTLFNVDKSTYRDRRWYKGPMMLASHFDLDPYFGLQAINNIQVCEMGSLPTEDESEFYTSIFSMKID